MSMTNSSEKPANIAVEQHRPIGLLIFILLFIAVIAISGRLFFLGADTLAAGDNLWRLSINITTKTTVDSTQLRIFPPLDTTNIRTIERNLSYPGFKVRKSPENKKYRRHVFITANESGLHNISADYLLHLSQTPLTSLAAINLSTQQRESFLLDNEVLQIKSYVVKELINKLQNHQPDQDALIESIFSYLKKLPVYRGKDAANVPKVLSRKKATLYERAIAMVALSRAGGIPARLVTGLVLKEDIDPQPHYWVEVFTDDQWLSYDVHFGYNKTVPINYLPLRRNDQDIVNIENGKQNQVEFDLEQEFNHPYLRKKQKDQFFTIFDLTRLPLDVRTEIALLLLLPLGALITVLFRQLIGVHSYGVFTPTLLALALVYTNVITTFIVFVVVIALAVAGRSIFPTTLSRTPRLSIIFTLIAFILTLSVSVLNYFDIAQEGKVFLLPIIILTSLVDRFYSTIEENGLNIAMIRMGWTVIITLFCLPVIQFETLGHLILNFPEIHFVTLALFLSLSLYKGKRLINIPYLKILAEPTPSRSKKKTA